MTTKIDWRAYIGPPWAPDGDSYYYNWTQHGAGEADTYSLNASLASSMTTLSTTVPGNGNISAFPTAGGVWVYGNGSGQTLEYIRYSGKSTNTLTGITRYDDMLSAHTAGAAIAFWYELDCNDGRLEWTRSTDGTLSSSSWTAQISGVKFPRAALRNHHLIVIQTRTPPTGTWTNTLVGWLMDISVRDDARRYGEWTAQIVSSAYMANEVEVGGLRIGGLDVAPHGSASAADPVAAAYFERSSGDYTASNPDLTASSANDGDPSTLWISDVYVGSQNWLASNSDPTIESGAVAMITGLYLSRPTGYASDGYRWIEITALATSVQDMVLMNEAVKAGTVDPPPILDIGFQNYGAGVKIIICEDSEIFERMHPGHTAKYVYELDSEIWSNFDLDDDFLILYKLAGDKELQHGLTWGTGTTSLTSAPDFDGTYTWTGTTITGPDPGEAMRYIWDGGGAGTSTTPLDYWEVGNVVAPGYTIGSYDEASGTRNEGRLIRPWVMLSLPGLGLYLKDDITNSSPGSGSELYLVDAAGNAYTGGLYGGGAFTIQVGDEQIRCSAKSDESVTVSSRGYNSTTAASHSAGDSVRVVASGVAVDAQPIRSLGWARYGGTIYPEDFFIFYSTLEAPRSPLEPYWGDDYTQVTVTGNSASSYTYDLPSTTRVTTYLLVFDTMTTDPARARVNELSAEVDESYYASSQWIADAENDTTAVLRFLTAAGFPSGARLVDTAGDSIDGVLTAAGNAWDLASDFAEYAGIRLDVGADSKVTSDASTFWTAGSYTAAETWTRDDAAAFEKQYNAGAVGQVRLAWRKADNSESGVAVWPTVAEDGPVIEVGPLIYATEAAAVIAASKRYYLSRYPYGAVLECAEGHPSIAPGAIHRVQWEIDAETVALDEYYVVTGVNHLIENRQWSTSLNLLEIDRDEA